MPRATAWTPAEDAYVRHLVEDAYVRHLVEEGRVTRRRRHRAPRAKIDRWWTMDWTTLLVPAIPGLLALLAVLVKEIRQGHSADKQTAMTGFGALTDNLQEEVDRLQTQVLELTDAWQRGAQANLDLRADVCELRAEIDRLKVKIVALEADREALRRENGRLRNQVRWLLDRLRHYGEVVADMEAQMQKEC